MNFDKIDSKTHFNILLRKKKEIEQALKETAKPLNGTIDFTMHKLNRDKRKLNEEIAKVNFRFMPDTIA